MATTDEAQSTTIHPPEIQPRGDLALRMIAMPADTNPAGDIFGGWIMSLMDLAAGVAAADRAKGRTATAAVATPCTRAITGLGSRTTRSISREHNAKVAS